jgi:ABC-2 type transport system ATP-binding protein
MVSARTGGLVVALGLGYAVAVGAGVASADPADGAGGTDSSTSTSAGPSTTSDSAKSPDTKKDSSPTSSVSASTHTSPSESATTEGSKAGDDDSADAKPVRKKHNSKSDNGSATEAVDAKPAESQAAEHAKPATEAAEPTAAEPKPAAEPATAPVTETATVTETAAVTEPKHEPDNTPAVPADTPADWTAAAAARRELTAEDTDVDKKVADNAVAQTAALSTPAAAPPVVAIPQIPPLGFLQQIPVLGPTVITPIVALIHQIPIAGDILHPFIGYPVDWSLPPGAPQARDVKVVSFDGTQIYVHFMPASGLTQNAKAPTVLNGPGLGVTGATNIDGTFLDPILLDTVAMMSPGTLRRAGYNVVTWDPRGEWNSGGTLELNAAEYEARDMSAIISWIATQPEALLDSPGDPRLGMVGVSYGGGIQLVTAANDTRVDAIVPAIAYNRLDTSLYKSGAFKTSWATPLTAVLELLGGRINPRILPATIYGDITGDLSPEDLALFLSRNPDISKITAPTLLIHGTVDTLFSLAEADATAQTLLQNGVPTKVSWFCGGHGVCANNLFDLTDGQLIERRTIEWLDRYVKEDPDVATGPQFEWVDQRGQWYSSDRYPVDKGASLTADLDSERTLPLIPYLGGSGIPFVPYALGAANAVNLRVPSTTTTSYLVGAPSLTLTYSGTGTASHVYAQLVDDQTGMVLGSLVTPVPVTLDGTSHQITVDLEPISHTLRPGETVTLQLVSSAGLYETIQPSVGTLTITGMRLSVPTADPAAVTPFDPRSMAVV